MKLAEALQERADINKKISELKRRLENCLLVQEGEEPAEDPMVLLNELDSATDRLEKLMASINETNCNTKANYAKTRRLTYFFFAGIHHDQIHCF